MEQERYSFYNNFSTRTDLERYGDNALLLYALQIKFAVEDIDEVASNSLVDGSDDKKTDLLYINSETNEAVIAQGFFSKKDRSEAPSNKASDLNTAVTWLLTRDINDLPDRIKSAAIELRQKIQDNEVSRITLWYCHNLPESNNVNQELTSAENTLSSILKNHYSDKNIESHSLEIGLNTLEEWYSGLTIPVLVTDTIELEDCEGFNASGPDWISFTTAFPAVKIYELYKLHNTKLFSANVRDYLGSHKSDSNINNGIKKTATENPENFFVFNNGITALVNEFNYENRKLVVNGLSIVNGAQTTGAIGNLPTAPNEGLRIPIRFIKCANPDTIASIVKFNNSQNKINAPDFRSSDQYQKRLYAEFKELGVIEYSARRGGSADIIKRNANILPSITAGQVLAAFHGEPSIAYNDKSKIWDSDRLYSKFFNEQTSAKHIFLTYSLIKAIEDLKLELVSADTLVGNQENLLKYLRSRGSIILFATAISDSLENILNRRIANKFSVRFCENIGLEEAKLTWRKIIDIGGSFVSTLNAGLEDGIKNEQKVNEARNTFKALMDAVKSANSSVIDEFSAKICI